MQKRYFIALAAFLFTCISANAKNPAWINTPAKVYPAEKYMFSVGHDSNRASAELNAVQGLAAMFSQSIKADSTAEKRLLEGKVNGTVANASLSSFDQKVIRNISQDDLIGIEIPEYYEDQKRSTWYVIAVIDRAKVTDLYESMISKNNESINKLLSRVNGISMDSYALCDYAADIAVLNERYLERLSVINSDAARRIQSSCKSSKDIKIKLFDIASKIPVYLSIKNDDTGKYSAAFANVITKYGFKTTKSDAARYYFTGSIEYSEAKTADGKNIHCRYELVTYLKDRLNNVELFPFALSGRASHYNFTGAKNRAEKTIEKKISSDFDNKFNEFLKQISVE